MKSQAFGVMFFVLLIVSPFTGSNAARYCADGKTVHVWVTAEYPDGEILGEWNEFYAIGRPREGEFEVGEEDGLPSEGGVVNLIFYCVRPGNVIEIQGWTYQDDEDHQMMGFRDVRVGEEDVYHAHIILEPNP